MFRTGSQFSLGHLIWRQKKCSSLLKYSFIIKCMEVNNSLLRWAPGIFYISLYTFNSFSSFLLILHSHHFPDSVHLELKALPVAPTETRVVPELKCRFVEEIGFLRCPLSCEACPRSDSSQHKTTRMHFSRYCLYFKSHLYLLFYERVYCSSAHPSFVKNQLNSSRLSNLTSCKISAFQM